MGQSLIEVFARQREVHHSRNLPDISVADPDPRVFGPPGSGSTSLSSCKNSKKNLDSYYLVTLFDFLSLKNDVNVASKSNRQKKLC